MKTDLICIAAHAGAGKTTFTRVMGSDIVRDVDAYRTHAIESRLAPLRRLENWDEHNALWHAHVRAHLARETPRPSILLVHHPVDSLGVIGRAPDAIVILPEQEVSRRIANIGAHDTHRAWCVRHNWESLRASIQDYPRVPIYESVERAVFSLLFGGIN